MIGIGLQTRVLPSLLSRSLKLRCMLLRCANVGSLILASNALRNVAKMSAAAFEVDPEYPGTAVGRRPAARALMLCCGIHIALCTG